MKAADGKIAERYVAAHRTFSTGKNVRPTASEYVAVIEELSAAEERERVLREALYYPRFGDTAALFEKCVDMLEQRDAELSALKGERWASLYINHFRNAIAGMREALATPAPQQPAKRYRLNSGPCAAMVVDCDCRICSPELEDRPAPCQCALCLATPAPEPSEQNELGSPQEIPREAIDLRTKYEALKLERDTERGLRLASEQENDRLRTERDGLKHQLADSELAFAHANEVVGKLEADLARLSAPGTIIRLPNAEDIDQGDDDDDGCVHDSDMEAR